MQLTNDILDILTAMKEDGRIQSILYNRAPRVNVDLPLRGLPAAVLYLITDITMDTATGMLRNRVSINLSFLERQKRLDFDAAEVEPDTDAMQDAARVFLAMFTELKGYTIVGGTVTARRVYDHRDVNTTGVNLQFTVTERQGSCLVCTEYGGDGYYYDDGGRVLYDDLQDVWYSRRAYRSYDCTASDMARRGAVLYDGGASVLYGGGAAVVWDGTEEEVTA